MTDYDKIAEIIEESQQESILLVFQRIMEHVSEGDSFREVCRILHDLKVIDERKMNFLINIERIKKMNKAASECK